LAVTDTQHDAPRLSITDVLGELDSGSDVLDRDPGLTVRGRPTDPGPARADAIARLKALAPGSEARIARGHEIGRGGMGVVYLAEQITLGRTVAVKELREDVRAPRHAATLLNEAFVLGSLEHPNVVPVHELMLDEHGHPVVVMKRIEGESWASLLRDEARVRDHHGAEDVLAWHLAVLVQVCNAVSFAHSRGILHRDLKPENVMIGRFGEVYVVDWGVAVALADDGTGRFPLASEVQSFAGTPRYMAPEMLGGRAATLSVRTDVYLLGATLFHVLAGRAPHEGENIMAIAANLATVEPELPPDAPTGLAAICRRAMAHEADARFESADALRAALVEHASHRHALLLAEEGEAKLAELRALVAAPTDGPEAHRARLFDTYSAARLGFRLALRIWPQSEAARAGLRGATETMIDYLLRAEDLDSATTLASQLDPPLDGELEARLLAAKDASHTARRRIAALEELGRDLDPAIGRRARLSLYAAIVGTLFVLEGVGHLHPTFESHLAFVVSSLLFLGLVSIIGGLGRRVLLATRLNRQIFFALVILGVAKTLVHGVIALLGQPPWHGQVLSGVVIAVTAAMLATTHRSHMLPVAVAFGGAALAGAWSPEQRHLFYVAACAATLLVILYAYRRSRADDPSGASG
jgi:serine/threonine-protein kinase